MAIHESTDARLIRLNQFARPGRLYAPGVADRVRRAKRTIEAGGDPSILLIEAEACAGLRPYVDIDIARGNVAGSLFDCDDIPECKGCGGDWKIPALEYGTVPPGGWDTCRGCGSRAKGTRRATARINGTRQVHGVIGSAALR